MYKDVNPCEKQNKMYFAEEIKLLEIYIFKQSKDVFTLLKDIKFCASHPWSLSFIQIYQEMLTMSQFCPWKFVFASGLQGPFFALSFLQAVFSGYDSSGLVFPARVLRTHGCGHWPLTAYMSVRVATVNFFSACFLRHSAARCLNIANIPLPKKNT